VSRTANLPEVRGRQGRRAGVVSRLMADAVDLLAVVLVALLLLLVAGGVRGLFGGSFDIPVLAGPVRSTLAALLVIAYLAYGWGLDGRTLGKLVLGLRAVDDGGGDLSPGRGLARAVLCLAFPPGLLWAAVSRRNASLQDLALRTAVIHDWGFAAPARTPAHPPPAARS
jgi:uncharacterized RDD family membrane protein YckC